MVEARADLGLPPTVELKFAKHSDKVRRGVLKAVSVQRFRYLSVVIEKRQIADRHFKNPNDFYQHVVELTFTTLETHLVEAFVEIDRTGGLGFGRKLTKRISQLVSTESGRALAKRVKMTRSSDSNRIQLADFVGGAVARNFNRAKDCDGSFREIVKRREIGVIVWP